MSRHPSGYVIYSGPSAIDGAPIVAIATGHHKRSTNVKTGAMVQVYILCSDIAPRAAVISGDDISICGDCSARGRDRNNEIVGSRSCYVQIDRAPSGMFKAYRRGRYPVLSLHAARMALAGRSVRLGSYGDPAAIPLAWLDYAMTDVDSHTGYTHQWSQKRVQGYRVWLMASTDNPAQTLRARLLGWRCFETRLASEPLLNDIRACPASKEAGHKVSCAACLACGGTESVERKRATRDRSIVVHGAASLIKAYAEMRARIDNV